MRRKVRFIFSPSFACQFTAFLSHNHQFIVHGAMVCGIGGQTKDVGKTMFSVQGIVDLWSYIMSIDRYSLSHIHSKGKYQMSNQDTLKFPLAQHSFPF